MEPRALELLVGADDRYALPLAVTLFSALEQLTPNRRVDVSIVDGGVHETNCRRLEGVLAPLPVKLRLNWIRPDERVLERLPVGQDVWSYLSKAMYFRLFAPEFITGDRVIYLDSDVLVQHNLEALWRLDLEGHAVAAATELGTGEGGNARYREVWQRQGLEPTLEHFNSGVLVIDLDYWRTHYVAARVFENIRAHTSDYRYPDQDGLNAVLADSWLKLDDLWNFQVNRYAFAHKRVPVDEAYVLHYSSPVKPWTELALSVERPYFAHYLRTLRRSGWFSPKADAVFHTKLGLATVQSLSLRAFQRLGLGQS